MSPTVIQGMQFLASLAAGCWFLASAKILGITGLTNGTKYPSSLPFPVGIAFHLVVCGGLFLA